MNPGISGVFLKTGPGTPLGVASLNLNLVASDYFESGGGGQTYICVTSVRAQRVIFAAGGSGALSGPSNFFLI